MCLNARRRVQWDPGTAANTGLGCVVKDVGLNLVDVLMYRTGSDYRKKQHVSVKTCITTGFRSLSLDACMSSPWPNLSCILRPAAADDDVMIV